MAKKTKIEIDPKDQEIEDLNREIEDLRIQMDLFVKENVRMEDRYNEEHKKRMRERAKAEEANKWLCDKVASLATQLNAAKELRAVEKSKRQASIPKFVIISAVAVVLLLVPCALQRWGIIGPQLGYAIECALMMVIAWCYALIWDRSKK